MSWKSFRSNDLLKNRFILVSLGFSGTRVEDFWGARINSVVSVE